MKLRGGGSEGVINEQLANVVHWWSQYHLTNMVITSESSFIDVDLVMIQWYGTSYVGTKE